GLGAAGRAGAAFAAAPDRRGDGRAGRGARQRLGGPRRAGADGLRSGAVGGHRLRPGARHRLRHGRAAPRLSLPRRVAGRRGLDVRPHLHRHGGARGADGRHAALPGCGAGELDARPRPAGARAGPRRPRRPAAPRRGAGGPFRPALRPRRDRGPLRPLGRAGDVRQRRGPRRDPPRRPPRRSWRAARRLLLQRQQDRHGGGRRRPRLGRTEAGRASALPRPGGPRTRRALPARNHRPRLRDVFPAGGGRPRAARRPARTGGGAARGLRALPGGARRTAGPPPHARSAVGPVVPLALRGSARPGGRRAGAGRAAAPLGRRGHREPPGVEAPAPATRFPRRPPSRRRRGRVPLRARPVPALRQRHGAAGAGPGDRGDARAVAAGGGV
ncbi:MAG: 4-keto-6-deoxy-N-Acetyl-D-hexosaminyl-(Lipid carrier) aminotransferase, partial [uncultured Acetobacteraceae bacterium]